MILWHKKAKKYIGRLEGKHRNRIKKAVKTFYEEGSGDVSRLKGFKDIYRLRVGDFRILFTYEDKNIYIVDVNIRGDIYKK
jgi:mRNA interferase RelE/StbE